MQGIVRKVSNAPSYDAVAWALNEPVKTFSQSVVDDTLKKNAEFQSKSGLRPKIIRTAEAGCCKWCSGLAGDESYPVKNHDMYRRHPNCRCKVEYDPGSGDRKTIHEHGDAAQKRAQEKEREERIKKYNTLSDEEKERQDVQRATRKNIATNHLTAQSENDIMQLQSEDNSEIVKRIMTEQTLALPKDSQDILREYTGALAQQVNNGIRNNRLSEKLQGKIVSLDKALADGLFPNGSVLYRNTSLSFLGLGISSNPPDEQLKFLTGRVVTNRIFTSTSFRDLELPGRNTLLKLTIPPAYKGCQYIAPVAYKQFKSQDEVLFLRGMRYRITSAKKNGNRLIIEVDVLKNE